MKNEALADYAKRLSILINFPHPVLIGLSFGGIVATEVTKFVMPELLLLIATAKTVTEVPWYYRLAGKFNLHRLLPTKFLKQHSFITDWFFGVQTDEDKMLLGEVLRDTHPKFLKWAINVIVKWRNKTTFHNTIHIHGTADRVLPFRFVKADIPIKGGGHFMTVNKVAEINDLLKTLLS